MKKYLVKRKNDEVVVSIMKHKGYELYSFVNLTKGHICECRFKSIEEALQDMDRQVEQGKILSYVEIKEKEKRKILLICGPSGCGKSYITDRLIEFDQFFKLPQYTTRDRREGEDPYEYNFITKEHYHIIKDKLVAKTDIQGNLYGTVPIFIKDKIGIVIVNRKGIEDFKEYAKTEGNIDLFILGIDSTIATARLGRDEKYVEEERQSLANIADGWLFNTEHSYINYNDVIDMLKENNFI